MADDRDAARLARWRVKRALDRTGRPGDVQAHGVGIHRGSGLLADVRRQHEAFDDLAVLEVRLDDLVDVVVVDEGVPDGFQGRPRATGPPAQRSKQPAAVDAHAARAGQALGLDA